MNQRVKHDQSVTVIGAGVIGLQIAVRLLEEGHRVVIVADQLPGDTSPHYTSPWAGAQWRPHSSADDLEQQAWDRESYLHWQRECLKSNEKDLQLADRSGLAMYPAKLIYDNGDHPDLAPTGDPRTSNGFWFRGFVHGFGSNVFARDMGKPYASVRYRTIFIDVPIYLNNLARRVTDLGGHLMRLKLPEEDGIAGAIYAAAKVLGQRFPQWNVRDAIFINTTGLRARVLCGDRSVHPVRGQVLVVKGVPKEAVTRLHKDERTGEPAISYVIPRPLTGVTVLGGCNQRDNWSTEENVGMTAQIKERCAALAPELLTGPGRTFEVVDCQVGLRPARTGGARVEREAVRDLDGQVRWVVHAYGHGGAGFQNSIGVAGKVSQLVAELTGKERARL